MSKKQPKPTDPTPPLTEAELEEIESHGTNWSRMESHGRWLSIPTVKNGIAMPSRAHAERIKVLWNNSDYLIAAARENAKAQAVARDYGQAFMLVWGMVMPENSAYTGCTQSAAEVLRHEVDLMRQSNKELARENAKLRDALVYLHETTDRDGCMADAAVHGYITELNTPRLGFDIIDALTAERDAALARVAELERYVEQLREPLLQEATDLGQEIESAPPPPDPKWVRCPAGCDNGSANSEPCEGCISSGRPGWVKETPQ